MAKVILISGSPKAEGNTAQLMNDCARLIREQGVEAEVVSFSGMKIESCTACGKCGESKECSLHDGLNEIMEKLRGAQGLLWVRPFTSARRAGT